ncbi:gliding motility-associated C-terminal domain-containing protein [bacterium]|nr:gliding motility-associated C-terminal domain-containing protein [bacterium]
MTNLAKVLLLAPVFIGLSSFVIPVGGFEKYSKSEDVSQRARQLDCIFKAQFDNIKIGSNGTAIEGNESNCLTAYSEFSPNGDGIHDIFLITCVEEYPNNYLQVFNRWGTKVFDMKGYDNTWDGASTGVATRGAKRKLPVGTYYYVLDMGDGTTKQKKGLALSQQIKF